MDPETRSTDGFYSGLVPVSRFRDLADPSRYRPVPADAVLFVADVVGSTAAIAAGRYKQVNVAAAATIAAVRNAMPDHDLPFSFGGDGAALVLDAARAGIGRRALAASARWSADALGLTLRTGAVPAADIRKAGRDLLVARFAASPDLAVAMFAGGGLAWAERQVKAGAYAIPPAKADGGTLDLDGLSCRFARLPARNGVILSVIAVPGPLDDGAAFPRLAMDLLDLAVSRDADVRPVREDGPPKLAWSLANVVTEIKAAAAKRGRLRAPFRSALSHVLAHVALKRDRKLGRFDPSRYMAALVRNTDFRKFDDGLRMTLDCGAETADEMEAFLARAEARGEVRFGLHRQGAAILTCFVPSATANDHVHFVDGAAGGYALAAAALKRKLDVAAPMAF
jgi:hypothetical protein